MKIATLDFFEKGNVAEWFTAISGIIIMFVVFRVVKIMVKFMTSEEYRTRLDPIHLIFMIGVASFSIAFAPIGYQYLNNVAITSVKQMSNFAPSDADINNSRNARISDILVEASSINLTGDSETGSIDQQIKQLDKDIARYQKEIEQAEADKKKSQPGDAIWNGANQTITKNRELIKEAEATKKQLSDKKKGLNIYDSNGFDINAEDSELHVLLLMDKPILHDRCCIPWIQNLPWGGTQHRQEKYPHMHPVSACTVRNRLTH